MKPFIAINLRCWCTILLSFSCFGSFGQERTEQGNLVLQNVPETPSQVKQRIQQYQNTRSASFEDWLPADRGMLISTRFGNTTQLHTINGPGSARNQITFFDEPVTNGAFCPSPDYNGFLFTKDIGGNEFSQIFWFDMESRRSEMISDGESVNFGIQWSNDGERFAFTSTRRNKKDFDIYISSIDDPVKVDLQLDKGNGYWIATDWSPDDSKLMVIQYLSANKSNSFIYDLKLKTLKQLNDPDEDAVFLAVAWDGSGEKIYAVSDRNREFTTLGVYHLASGEFEYITSSIPWDVEEFVLNHHRSIAAFTVNENGFTQLYTMNTSTGEYDKVANLPIGQVYAIKFHPTHNTLALVLNTPETPGDTYTLELDTNQLTRWTTSEVGGLNTAKFPKPEFISYETFDQHQGAPRKIPGFVYKPDNNQEPHPVVINIHGGPEGQFIPFFASFTAYLVNELGIAVVAPNVRGSSGYGKNYLKLDNGFNREHSVEDIGALLDWIEDQPELDASKVAVLGGSYGGYMVLASMFNYDSRIACGVDIVGISNFVTFLENTEEYRRDQRRVEYGDERDPKMREYLNSISPNNNAEKITKPLFVIQGANDPRVPASESEQMVEVIRKNSGDVWYMLAKDEGHGFRKKENRDRMTEAMSLFFQKYLLKSETIN